MIIDIRLDIGPIDPGEARALVAWSDDGPLSVEIRCFREPPQPAKLQPCQECGRFTVNSGDEVLVTASQEVFEEAPGFLFVSVVDQAGDKRDFRLTVRTIDIERVAPYGS